MSSPYFYSPVVLTIATCNYGHLVNADGLKFEFTGQAQNHIHHYDLIGE